MSRIRNLYSKSLKRLSVELYGFIRKKLWAKIIFAMFLGVGVGILMGDSLGIVERDLAITIGDWLAVPGNLFLSLIQMIVIPLVIASIIRGIATTDDIEQLKKVGIRLVIYFLITTTVAITIGLLVALIIQPGNYIDISTANIQDSAQQVENVADAEIGSGSIPEMVTDLLPENPLSAMVERQMLQVVIFSIIFGIALVVMDREKAGPILDILSSLQDVCMTIVKWAMLLVPYAVFGLLARITIKVGLDAMLGMAVYMGTVLLGLFILLVFYLLIVTIFGKRNPFEFLSNIRDVQLLAFSTSSSAAVMPLSMEVAEDKLNVRESISQFLIPLGATINMDGTALYQGVATVFLAQVYNVNLGLPQLILVIVTAVGASIGSPATPGVGIVILSIVLKSVGIPNSGVALILGVDRILDMSRTALNVTGDLTANVVMNKWVPKKEEKTA